MQPAFPFLLLVLFGTLAVGSARAERRVRDQPTVPTEYREIPFLDSAPEPEITEGEKKRGYLLFQRPISEPVYANTHPLKGERLTEGGLSAFATPGEWEPVTLGVYPVRDLQNFRVKVSNLTGPDGGTIDTSHLTVRIQTYWNMGYPSYASRETYRRLPELMELVECHSSPARECQRWWIQVHVPVNAKAGLYQGTVTLQDDGFSEVVEIPLSLRVLGFPLSRDPAKHYTAYYQARDRVTYQDKDEAFYQKASANEYLAMRDYGIDQFPTLVLTANPEITKLSIQNEEEIERFISSGMDGRIPILGGNPIARLYLATTPGGERGGHWAVSKMPPPEFYTRLTQLFRDFEKERIARGWPPMICCPLDEVASSHEEFGVKVFEAVHRAGISTYITKSPTAVDARSYASYVDVWCSQPYAIPYEQIVNQDRHEYWSYPNHNAGEQKDRRVMCKGGRMTYGFGFWRSGYTTLIPWHWSWTMLPDPFDYLRSTKSGCGMRIDETGEVIPPIYWECFREGRDDARYLYTLQQAVFEREDSNDQACKEQVANAKALLQENWDSIQVQQRYLSEGMWPSEEFNVRRWRLAAMIEALLDFPVTKEGIAPSVLVERTSPRASTGTSVEAILEKAIVDGIVTSRDLGGDFSEWKNGTIEGKTELTSKASPKEGPGLRWRVQVDYSQGSDANNLVGWPRIRRTFKKDELDFTRYDFLEFLIRVESDRDEVADDITLFGLSIRNYGEPDRLYETRIDLGDQQRVWLPVRFSVKELIETAALGETPWESIQSLQLFISESDYLDQTNLTFEIGSVRLLATSRPLLSHLETASYLLLPAANFPVSFEVIGLGTATKGSHVVSASLVDEKGAVCASRKQDLVAGGGLDLDIGKLRPGKYTLRTQISTAAGEPCSELSRSVEAIAGPFSGE